jgi:DNA-binding response OmpR family regulator
MERKLSILLVEDDPNACKDMIEDIEELDDTALIGVTNNSTKAVDYIKDYLPDAVILDLELHQGSGNGLFVDQQNKNGCRN